MKLKAKDIKPIFPGDKLLAHFLKTPVNLDIDTQPRTEKEFAEDHILGEILNEKRTT